MKKIWKQPNFYFAIGIAVMVVLFISSSQTYAQQSQVGTIDRLLHGEPFKALLTNISFEYAGTKVSIEALGYSKFVEFFK